MALKLDFEALCRTCLRSDNLNPIFLNSTKSTRYSIAIYMIAGLKVEINDGLPQKMCITCINNLNSAINFRKQCKDAETQLLQAKTESETDLFVPEVSMEEKGDEEEIREDKNESMELDNDCDDDRPINDFVNETVVNDEGNDMVPINSIEEIETKIIERKRLKRKKINADGPLCKILNKADKNQRVNCNICQKELSIRSIDRHMASYHPALDARVKCELCDSRVTREKMDRHLRLMHGPGNLTYGSIDRHMASYHPALDARVKCELCDSRVTREKMDRHLRLMHGPGNLTCGYCKTEFQDRESLVEHITTCTAKKKRKPYKKGRELAECDLCQKVMQRASLRLHKAVKHKGLRPVCEHCGRSFGNSIRLHEHYRAKHGYEKFKCGRCDYQSASELAMQNHERRHRGEKPFVCEECGARFHAAYLLAQHKRGHTTEKPVKCDQCPSSFKSNNSLLTHKQTCHSDRSYVCLVCARAYRCRHYAVKHSRAVHRLRGPPPIARGDLGSVGGTLETAT